MLYRTQINLSRYEKAGLERIKEKRQVSRSELIREGIRLLMKNEGIEVKAEAKPS